MLNNDPLILYGPHIILSCTIIHWALIQYLQDYLYKDDNYDQNQN
jgi:hypothetical protein